MRAQAEKREAGGTGDQRHDCRSGDGLSRDTTQRKYHVQLLFARPARRNQLKSTCAVTLASISVKA